VSQKDHPLLFIGIMFIWLRRTPLRYCSFAPPKEPRKALDWRAQRS